MMWRDWHQDGTGDESAGNGMCCSILMEGCM